MAKESRSRDDILSLHDSDEQSKTVKADNANNHSVEVEDSETTPLEKTIEMNGVDHNSTNSPGRSRGKVKALYRFKRGATVVGKKVEKSCCDYWSDVCSVKTVKQKLPIITWLPKYSANKFKCDLIAGLTVGLTVIPQGMAYAALAGLELQYGLYSAFMGSFIYCLMGTSKDITMGPTAIMSILVAEYCEDPWTHHEEGSSETTNVTLAILLAFLCGVIQFVMSIFRLGFLVRYISHPVITGFMSAAAIVISMTQFKKIFGIITPRGFFKTIGYLLTHLYQTKKYDLILGLSCMAILFFLKWAKERWSKRKEGVHDNMCISILRTILWFVGTSRNAVVVIVSACIAYGITDIEIPVGIRPLTLTQNITGGVPPFRVPMFSYDVPGENRTIEFPELLSTLGSGLIVVPLIGFLESIAIAKAFSRKGDYKVDAGQELLTIGLTNFLSSFVSSYPVTGSFGRSAVNAQSNVATPMGGVFTGVVVLLALEFLSSTFQYIPAAALAAVIIMAVINLFDFRGMLHIWHINKLDFLPMLVTFFLCFWDIAYGIMAGIGVAIILLLAQHSRPQAKVEVEGDIVTMRVKRGLDFPGAEYMEDKLTEQTDSGNIKHVIVDCSNFTELDYSAAEAINHGSEALKKSNISLKLCGLKTHQEKMLKRMDIFNNGVKFYDTIEEAEEDTPRIFVTPVPNTEDDCAV